jgi:hypothetical protein
MSVSLLYIDPQSGSLLFQLLLSGLLSILIFFKRIVMFVRVLFHKKKPGNDDEQPL